MRIRILVHQLGRDVRDGLRQVRRNPAFSAVAVATLALGIGANTAMFSAVDAVLIRPLPYADAGRLVMVWDDVRQTDSNHFFTTPPEWSEWRRQNTVFTDIAASEPGDAALSGDGEPEEVPARKVTANFWSVLDVKPLVGRVFTENEDVTGARVLVISHGLWQRRFGGSPDVVGRTITLNDMAYEVIGVMPREFYFMPARDIDVWMPTSFTPAKLRNFGWHDVHTVARLKAGVTLRQAQDAMAALNLRVSAAVDIKPARSAMVTPLRDELAGTTGASLIALLCASAAVLAYRVRQPGQPADGARGGAPPRSSGARSARRRTRPADRAVPRREPDPRGTRCRRRPRAGHPGHTVSRDAHSADDGCRAPDARRAGAAVLRGDRGRRRHHVRTDTRPPRLARGVTGRTARRRPRQCLGAQPLFPAFADRRRDGARRPAADGGGLLLQTFHQLREIDLGIRSENVLTFVTPLFRYRDFDRRVAFVNAELEKIRAIPGVINAAAISRIPLAVTDQATFYRLAGQSNDDARVQVALSRVVTRDYFATVGARLREGRFFDAPDRRSQTPAALVNESFANRNFPGGKALGARFKFGALGEQGYWYTIVGVVKEIRDRGVVEDLKPAVYRLHEQADQSGDEPSGIVVRTAVEPLSIVPTVRQAIWSLDRNQPITQIQTVDDIVARQLSVPSQNTALLGAFALLALLLASIGLYGVLSYAVTQRTGEIGVRMALGATSGHILRSIGRQGLALTFAGLVIGVVLAAIAARVMTALFFGVRPDYVPVVGVVSLVLLAVAATACFVPARRASRVDPVAALQRG